MGSAVGNNLNDTFGKNDPPAPPNYFGAAVGQGQANLQSAITNYLLGNSNQVTPFGSLNSQQTGSFNLPSINIPGVGQIPSMDIPTFTQTTTLSPQQQAIFDQQQKAKGDLANLTAGQTANVSNALSQPYSYANAGDLQDKVQNAIMSRLQPQFDRDEEALRSRLANQGIAAGSDAYNKDWTLFNQAKNDASTQAVLAGMQAAPYALQQDAYLRAQPLNELMALMNGSQVQMPQFQQPFSLGVQPGNYQAATSALGDYQTDVFNYQNQQTANTLNAILNGGAMAYKMGGFGK